LWISINSKEVTDFRMMEWWPVVVFWTIMYVGWHYRNGLLVPKAEYLPIPRAMFKIDCQLEAFRRFIEAKEDLFGRFWVWSEFRMEEELNWLDFPKEEEGNSFQVEEYLTFCQGHYPMVRRDQFTKETVKLMKVAYRNVSKLPEPEESEGSEVDED